MKKKNGYGLLLAAAVGISVLTGCSKESTKNQAEYRQIGITCMEQGDYEGAVEAFQTALQQKIGGVGADELDICYYKGAAQFAGGDFAGAMETYNAILAYDKKEADAYYLRGCLYLKQGDTEAAKKDFESAVAYHPNEYELYLNIYENLAAYGFTDEGKAYLNRAFTIKGDGLSNLEYRGRIYYLLGDYESAQVDLLTALKAGSTIANLYLAQTYDAMGKNEEAETYYEAYLSVNAESPEALGALGGIMLKKEAYDKAIVYLEQALEYTDGINRVMLQDLVIANEYQGNFAKAWELIQEYVSLFPEDEKAQQEYIFLKNRQMQTKLDSPTVSNQ